MSDQNLPDVSDEFEDLPPFPEEEIDEPAPEEDEESAAKSEEAPEESEEESPDTEPTEPDDDGVPDLSTLPEEHQALAKTYAERRLAGLQRTWQEKLEAAAALEKQAEIVRAFDQRMKEDPDGLIEDMKAMRDKSRPPAPKAPPEPGEPPDPVDDPQAFRDWLQAKDAFTEYRVQTALAQKDDQLEQVLQRHKQTVAREQLAQIQQSVKATDEDWREVQNLAMKTQSDPKVAWSLLNELVSLRKQVSEKKTTDRRHVKDAIRGTEEKPGLPEGRAHQRPRKTGNEADDLIAALKADGVVIPDDL